MAPDERVFDLNTTEPRSPEFMLGYCAYKPGDTLMHCPFPMLVEPEDYETPSDRAKFQGWYAAWEDYQDRLRQFGQ